MAAAVPHTSRRGETMDLSDENHRVFQDKATEEFGANPLTTGSAIDKTNAFTDLEVVLHDGSGLRRAGTGS